MFNSVSALPVILTDLATQVVLQPRSNNHLLPTSSICSTNHYLLSTATINSAMYQHPLRKQI